MHIWPFLLGLVVVLFIAIFILLLVSTPCATGGCRAEMVAAKRAQTKPKIALVTYCLYPNTSPFMNALLHFYAPIVDEVHVMCSKHADPPWNTEALGLPLFLHRADGFQDIPSNEAIPANFNRTIHDFTNRMINEKLVPHFDIVINADSDEFCVDVHSQTDPLPHAAIRELLDSDMVCLRPERVFTGHDPTRKVVPSDPGRFMYDIIPTTDWYPVPKEIGWGKPMFLNCRVVRDRRVEYCMGHHYLLLDGVRTDSELVSKSVDFLHFRDITPREDAAQRPTYLFYKGITPQRWTAPWLSNHNASGTSTSAIPSSPTSIANKWTVVIITAPSRSNPSTSIIGRVVDGIIKHAPQLSGALCVVGFDGEVPTGTYDPPLNPHCNRPPPSDASAYPSYIEATKALVAKRFTQCKFITNERRVCFSTGLRRAMEHVKTPFVFVVEDDVCPMLTIPLLQAEAALASGKVDAITMSAYTHHTINSYWTSNAKRMGLLPLPDCLPETHCGLTLLPAMSYGNNNTLATTKWYKNHVLPRSPDHSFPELDLKFEPLRARKGIIPQQGWSMFLLSQPTGYTPTSEHLDARTFSG